MFMEKVESRWGQQIKGYHSDVGTWHVERTSTTLTRLCPSCLLMRPMPFTLRDLCSIPLALFLSVTTDVHCRVDL